MGKYQGYSSYKDSGVEWLGNIPEHWSSARLRFAIEINPSKREVTLKQDDLVSFVPMESVREYGGIDLAFEKTLEDVFSSYTYFADNDVVFAKITPCFENGKSAIAKNLKNGVGFGTTELHVLRAGKNTNNHFIFYIIISHLFQHFGEAEMYGAGGQKRVPENYIKNFRFAFPPLDEQESIACFLDRKTSQIDALIAKKAALLEKLDEKRTALISHAVTKGLDPIVPMKDSGVEWLGDIPEHWDVKKIQYIGRLRSGNNIISQQIEVDALYPVFGGNGLRGYFNSYTHDGDYILIGRQGALCGNINYARGKFWASDHAVVIHPSSEFNIHWLGELLTAMNLNQYSTSAAQPGLSVEQISRLKIPFTCIEEQNQISEYLDRETTKINRQKAKVKKAIKLLKEYRTALITNAVTGKIDVRQVTSV